MGYFRTVTRAILGQKASRMTPQTLAALVAGTSTEGKVGTSYQSLAKDGYGRNVFAHRAISEIARSVASVQVNAFRGDREVPDHPVVGLLRKPNTRQGYHALLEMMTAYYLIAGNTYLRAWPPDGGKPTALLALRPDWMTVRRIRGQGAIPMTIFDYSPPSEYDDQFQARISDVEQSPEILHVKTFNPTSDLLGLSPLLVGRGPISRHNLVEQWNSNLVENGARPPGVFSVKMTKEGEGSLTPEDREIIKAELESWFLGPMNAGRPPVLEGGLEWKATGLSPLDMDWSTSKQSAARDIGTALGYPPFLFGIPGDNTYSNQREARLALWEDTIIPLASLLIGQLSNWLAMLYGQPDLEIQPDFDGVAALALRRERMWERVAKASWLTPNEQRAATGYEVREEEEADQLYITASQVPLSLGAIAPDLGDPSRMSSETLPSSSRVGDAKPGEAVSKDIVLNGAQITSLLAVLEQVRIGAVPKASATEILQAAFGMSGQQARAILNPIVIDQGAAMMAGPGNTRMLPVSGEKLFEWFADWTGGSREKANGGSDTTTPEDVSGG